MVSIQHGELSKVKRSELRHYINALKKLEVHSKNDRKYFLRMCDKKTLDQYLSNPRRTYQELYFYHKFYTEKAAILRRTGLSALGGIGVSGASAYSLLTIGASFFFVPMILGAGVSMFAGTGILVASGISAKDYKYPKEHIELRDYYKMKIEDYDYLHKEVLS